MQRSVGAVFVFAALLPAATAAPAELPAMHAASGKPAETPSENGRGFDIPGSGLHVTFGGYIEGAVTATVPNNAAAATPAHRRKPTP